MSAPYFPSSNARAELAVKKVIKLLEEATNEEGWIDDEYIKMSLMTIRNTPDKNGISPSQILFGRPIKDHLPNVNQHGKDIDQPWRAIWSYKGRSDQKKRRQEQQNKDKLGRKYTQLEIGQYVRIENIDR